MPAIQEFFSGVNSAIFAYGQTGSGKTYSIFGDETSGFNSRGIVSWALDQFFKLKQPNEILKM